MKVFIVGGGFAGLGAANSLAKELSGSNEIYLIDKNKYTTMLPNLPEVCSDRLKSEDITGDIEKLIPPSVKFINEEISEINFDEKIIKTNRESYSYDYLVFGSGSITNFYGFNQNLDKVSVLDSLEAAQDINVKFKEYLDKTNSPTLVISGAGFTGIELGCNLYDLSKRSGKSLNVVFVELGKRILPMLSEKSHKHVLEVFDKLGFKLYTDNKIVAFDGNNVTLKDDEVIKDVFFSWCSGVKSSLNPIGNYESLPDGRIIVNEFLSIPAYPEVYAVGDSAAIKDKDTRYLRRAVNFAHTSGKHAGSNIAAVINNGKQKPFEPVDMGWIIPIYISSIGEVMGKEITGRKGIAMHYAICGVKNYSVKNAVTEFNAAVKYAFAKP
jgi:NADH dehydrogenase